MSGHYRKEKDCLNCGHHVEEHYCSHCGQPNLELKEPFWHFIGHSIGHYFHFDSKFFKTMVPLLTKPGQLTLDYLAGRRARYIHPVSLYIFVSIVYFLVVPRASKENDSEAERVKTETLAERKASEGIMKQQSRLDAMVPGIAGEMVNEIGASAFSKLNTSQRQIYLDSLKKIQAAKPADSLQKTIDRFTLIHTEKLDSTYELYVKRQESLPESQRDSWIDRKAKQAEYYAGDKEALKTKIKGDKNQHNDAEHKIDIKEELEKYAPKQYFLLMPLLAFFIMVNFRKNHIYYIDHLVFTIHGMTAYFIISILTKPIEKYVFGLDSWMSSVIGLLVFIGVVWYLYSGLKLFYNRSRNVTIRKTITVMFMYSLAVGISSWVIKMMILHVLH